MLSYITLLHNWLPDLSLILTLYQLVLYERFAKLQDISRLLLLPLIYLTPGDARPANARPRHCRFLLEEVLKTGINIFSI